MAAEPGQMRILMTADTVGGVWPFALELARELVRQGDRVLLAAMGREPDVEQRREAAAVTGLELQARPYRLVWMQDPWDDLDAAHAWLRDLARRIGADVIHLNDLALADREWPAPVLLTAHSCVCSWWQAVHGEAAPAQWARYRDTVAASVRAADRVVAPTRAMLQCLVEQHDVPRSYEVIHNGRTPVGSVADKEPFVLGAGRLWDPAKNLGLLAQVAPTLPWPVHLAGETRHPDGGADAALASVQRLGALPGAQLRDWMTRAAIYALPARYEPFGLSALEAAQAGCALVLGDIPSLREVWGEAALYVGPGDADALRGTVLRLIGDDALRQRMSRLARERAGRYTPQAMGRRYREAYAALRAPRPAARGRPPAAVAVAAGAQA